jgi:hypothetical protein
MLVELQVSGVIVPSLTVLVPCVAPKLEPAMVTVCPALAVLGDRLVIDGVGGVDTKILFVLLVAPPTVTEMVFDVAGLGTTNWMLVAPQLEGVTAAPFNLSVLLP